MNWQKWIKEWRTAAMAAGFEVEVIAEKGGYEILGCTKGEGPCVYLSSGIHGDEPAGPQALLRLLEEGFFSNDYRWLIAPALNPVGLSLGIRENGEGIDLNRDYLSKETDEVRAHIKWLQRQATPEMFLSLHEDWESSGIYYYEINRGVKGASYEEMLAAAAPYFAPEPEMIIDDHEVTKAGWIYHVDEPDIPEGWPEAIYLAKQGCRLSLTLETPSSQELETRICCHIAMVKKAISSFALRTLV